MKPELRRYLLGFGISMSGDWLQITALGWFMVHELDLSSNSYAMARAIFALTAILCRPMAGPIVGRSSRRKVLINCNFLFFSISMVTVFLAMGGSLGLGAIILLRSISGAIQALSGTADEQYVRDLDEENRLNGNWMKDVIHWATRLIFGAVAGVVLETLGTVALFAIDGLSFLVFLLVLWTIPDKGKKKGNGEKSILQRIQRLLAELWLGLKEWRSGFAYVLARRDLTVLLWLLSIMECFVFVSWVFLPEIINKDLGKGGFEYAIVISLSAVGGLLGSALTRLIIAKHEGWLRGMVIISLIGCPLSGLGIAMTHDVWLIACCYAAALMFIAPFSTFITHHFQGTSEPALAISIKGFVSRGLAPLIQLATAQICVLLEIPAWQGLALSASFALLLSLVSLLLAWQAVNCAVKEMYPETKFNAVTVEN